MRTPWKTTMLALLIAGMTAVTGCSSEETLPGAAQSSAAGRAAGENPAQEQITGQDAQDAAAGHTAGDHSNEQFALAALTGDVKDADGLTPSVENPAATTVLAGVTAAYVATPLSSAPVGELRLPFGCSALGPAIYDAALATLQARGPFFLSEVPGPRGNECVISLHDPRGDAIYGDNPTGFTNDLPAIAQQMVVAAGGPIQVALADGAQVGAAGIEGTFPAWSTSKVPLSIASLRHTGGQTTSLMQAAITQSDNAAAAGLWNSLGGGQQAADQITGVIREGGDQVSTVPPATSTGYSAFGQTMWTAANQATFTFGLPCIANSGPVINAMHNIVPGQRYGLGQIPNMALKGGWGPDAIGAYTVRQLGLLQTDRGDIAVSLVARPTSGTYEQGQVMLNNAAAVLREALADGSVQPIRRCGG
ncbi:hypothetical protein CCHOA_08970 [Corynebacterium choanae]|uniref:Serine hydrolase n=1 Tax=Corynebacterium choanae TaxID=1862358 RepID=A0A3G6J7Z4_9CORY|nr:hypothetical protein CCHOA_08970 [Corynebacterium choanae]